MLPKHSSCAFLRGYASQNRRNSFSWVERQRNASWNSSAHWLGLRRLPPLCGNYFRREGCQGHLIRETCRRLVESITRATSPSQTLRDRLPVVFGCEDAVRAFDLKRRVWHSQLSDYDVEVVEHYMRVLDVYIIRLDLGALRQPQPSSGLCGPAVASIERYHRKLSHSPSDVSRSAYHCGLGAGAGPTPVGSAWFGSRLDLSNEFLWAREKTVSFGTATSSWRLFSALSRRSRRRATAETDPPYDDQVGRDKLAGHN